VSIVKVNEAPKPAVNNHPNYVTSNLTRPQRANHQRLLIHDLNPTYVNYTQAETIPNQNQNAGYKIFSKYNAIALPPPYQTRTENLILYKIKDPSYPEEPIIIKKSVPSQTDNELNVYGEAGKTSSNSSNNIESDYNSGSFTSNNDSFSTPLDKTPNFNRKFYPYQPNLRPRWQPTYR